MPARSASSKLDPDADARGQSAPEHPMENRDQTSAVNGGERRANMVADWAGKRFPPVSLTFSPGDTEMTITVSIVDDALVEADEQLFMSLTNAQGAFLEQGGANVAIEDNDVGVGITDATINEWDGAATVTVALSGATQQTVTFDYRTEPGNATAGEDFLPGTGTGEIAAGETEATIAIPILDDALVDARDDIILDVDESFDLELWSVIASKEGGSKWVFEFPNVVIQDEPEDSCRRVAVTATNTFSQPTPGFYRLNVRMR